MPSVTHTSPTQFLSTLSKYWRTYSVAKSQQVSMANNAFIENIILPVVDALLQVNMALKAF